MPSTSAATAYQMELNQQKLKFYCRKLREMNELSMEDPWGYDYSAELKKFKADHAADLKIIEQAEKEWAK